MRASKISEIMISKLLYLIIICLSFTCIYPFIYAVAMSFNEGIDALRGGIYFFPRKFTFDNYRMIFEDENLLGSYIISISRTVLGVLFSIVVNTLFAYSLSKRQLKCKKLFNYIVIIPMYFNVGFLPLYLVLKMYKLINSFWVFILPTVVWSFGIILMKAFISELPGSIEESALIDGAGHFTILTRIVFPLTMPVIAVIMLNVGVYHWNDWFMGVAYMSDISSYPSASLLYKMLQDNSITDKMVSGNSEFTKQATIMPETLKLTMLVIMVIPIVFVYPFLQRYFAQGIMIGAIKG